MLVSTGANSSDEVFRKLNQGVAQSPATQERSPAPKPPTAEVSKPIHVSSGVQAANIIKQPKPGYPPFARQARVQGTVRFQATIAKNGTIQNLQLLGGPPLLVQAVQQWLYKPTLLNGEPVEVITTIDVNFALSQ